jgi:hypothetical protein
MGLFLLYILGVFAKLRKATTSVVTPFSVRKSAWNNSTPIGRIFMKFDSKMLIKFKSDENNG